MRRTLGTPINNGRIWFEANVESPAITWDDFSVGGTTVPPPPPLPPVASLPTNITQTSFTANWSISAGATGYDLDVATDGAFATYVPGYQNFNVGNVTLASVTGLTPGTTYYYRLRAYSANGTSGNSNTVTATTVGPPPVPPVASLPTNITQTSFTANWSASTGATGYDLDVATDSLFATYVPGYQNLNVGNVTLSSVTGLTAGTAYYYRVRAYSPNGTSGNSNTVTVTTLTNVAVGNPPTYTTNFPLTENPISEGGKWINGGSVGLDWTNCSTTPGLAIGLESGSVNHTDGTALLTGSWGPNQSAMATVYTVNQNDSCYEEVELRLRSTLSAHSCTGYEISMKCSKTSNAYLLIVRWNGPVGNFTVLTRMDGATYGVANGDSVRATIVGNTITAYINGVQKAQVIDYTYTTGNPGMGFNLNGCTGVNGDYGLTSYTATFDTAVSVVVVPTNYNPVQTATQSWWESSTSFPCVFEDTSFVGRPRYHMVFDGHGSLPGRHAKGYAFSSDLQHWTSYDAGLPHPPNANPIVGPRIDSTSTYVGSDNFAWGDAIKVRGTYYIFPYEFGIGTAVRIESTDLETWSNIQPLINKQPPEIVGNETIGTGVAILKQGDGITPIAVDGKYWMIFFHGDNAGMMWLAYADTASNLLTWTLTKVLIYPTPHTWYAGGIWTPSFVRLNNNYYIYAEGDSGGGYWETGYARASALNSSGNSARPDSTTWTISAQSVVKHGVSGAWDSNFCIDPVIRQFSNGTYYLFYTGNIANGYLIASSPEGPWQLQANGPTVPTVASVPTVPAEALTVSERDPKATTPATLSLGQNYPNPFNPATTIWYQLPLDSRVRIVVYDILGREVRALVDEPKAAGYYSVQFDARDVASGTYFCRMVAEPITGKGSYAFTKKMMVLK